MPGAPVSRTNSASLPSILTRTIGSGSVLTKGMSTSEPCIETPKSPGLPSMSFKACMRLCASGSFGAS
jgi:hypothetical protein